MEPSISTVLEMLRRLPHRKRLRVIAQALPEIDQEWPGQHRPLKSLLGLCTDLGSAPSAISIDQSRQEVWKNFPREW